MLHSAFVVCKQRLAPSSDKDENLKQLLTATDPGLPTDAFSISEHFLSACLWISHGTSCSSHCNSTLHVSWRCAPTLRTVAARICSAVAHRNGTINVPLRCAPALPTRTATVQSMYHGGAHKPPVEVRLLKLAVIRCFEPLSFGGVQSKASLGIPWNIFGNACRLTNALSKARYVLSMGALKLCLMTIKSGTSASSF